MTESGAPSRAPFFTKFGPSKTESGIWPANEEKLLHGRAQSESHSTRTPGKVGVKNIATGRSSRAPSHLTTRSYQLRHQNRRQSTSARSWIELPQLTLLQSDIALSPAVIAEYHRLKDTPCQDYRITRGLFHGPKERQPIAPVQAAPKEEEAVAAEKEDEGAAGGEDKKEEGAVGGEDSEEEETLQLLYESLSIEEPTQAPIPPPPKPTEPTRQARSRGRGQTGTQLSKGDQVNEGRAET
ncbi:hypothetical protein DAPPUDRAFT_245916 [Daphnia pulex]|uniref:Uncharacterized protein n=1 Tax=Daphnia pulex TaxID=6669 RepID=E9GPA4_DAPPU|nr:hypothetical protein DAPPUDRAFT_245916 [Daphnia pulex]|eukprot:EFX78716.1 hypothetical protein DAPPUDRAFT_245916 [Daphnia pulex]